MVLGEDCLRKTSQIVCSEGLHMDVHSAAASRIVAPMRDCAVVVCADRKFFPAAYLLCVSLMREQPERHDVYLLTEPGPHLDRVPADVSFRIQTPNFIGRLPNVPGLLDRLGPFTFLRLFVADMFEDYRRVLYLDCDIRVDGSIAPLLRLDMKGAAIAAVDDVMTYWHPGMVVGTPHPHLAALGFEPEWPYFNAGVMLLDCERWRRDQMTSAALECLSRLGPMAVHCDQDALNVAFRAQWLPLSPRWNFPAVAFETGVETVLKPVLYHHTHYKPWIFGRAIRREAKKFRQAMRSTPYHPFHERPTPHRVKRLIEGRIKELIQNATFFLASSRKRIEERKRMEARTPSVVRSGTAYIVKSVESHRFADVDQKISVIDVAALSALVNA